MINSFNPHVLILLFVSCFTDGGSESALTTFSEWQDYEWFFISRLFYMFQIFYNVIINKMSFRTNQERQQLPRRNTSRGQAALR